MGVMVNGNKNWLALGPVQIQPAELAKLAVILWCAARLRHARSGCSATGGTR